MTDKYFEVEGKKVHYVVAGRRNGDNDKPVLLLHGFTEAVFVWEDLMRHLADNGFYALALDMAGHGETDLFSDTHTVEFQADLARRALRNEGLDYAAVIGHSMGGYVAAAFAELYPEAVKGVGFFHSNPGADTPQGIENRRRTLKLLESGHTAFMGEFTESLFAEGTARQYPEALQALRDSVQKMGAGKIAAAQRGMMVRPSRLHIYEMPVPFLFIIGKRDTKADLSKMLAQTVLPHTAHVLFIESGHMGMYECPNQTKSFILGWLRAINW